MYESLTPTLSHCVGYCDEDGKQTLSDIELSFSKGDRIALVGESGSGKSSLMAILRGLYDPDRVRFTLDGKEFEMLSPIFGTTTLIPQEMLNSYPDGLTVITLGHYTDDLHAAFMAFKIGTGLEEKNHDVVIFLNLEAVRMAHTHQPLDMAWGHNADFSALYQKFLDNGGEIMVCPHCAKAAGISPGDLRPGTIIAKEGQVIDLIAMADKIVSY